MDTIPVGEPFNRTGRTKGFHVAQIIQVLLFEPTNPTLTAGYVCVVTCCSQTVVVLKLSAENSVQLAVGKFKLGRLLPWYSESDSKTWTRSLTPDPRLAHLSACSSLLLFATIRRARRCHGSCSASG